MAGEVSEDSRVPNEVGAPNVNQRLTQKRPVNGALECSRMSGCSAQVEPMPAHSDGVDDHYDFSSMRPAFFPLCHCLECFVKDPIGLIGADGYLAHERRGQQRAELCSQLHAGLQQGHDLAEPAFVTLETVFPQYALANIHDEFRRQFGQEE